MSGVKVPHVRRGPPCDSVSGFPELTWASRKTIKSSSKVYFQVRQSISNFSTQLFIPVNCDQPAVHINILKSGQSLVCQPKLKFRFFYNLTTIEVAQLLKNHGAKNLIFDG